MQKSPIAVVLVALALTGCEGTSHMSSPAIPGRVIDAAGAPIEGAIVYALWHADMAPKSVSAHDSPHACYHVEAAVSAADGTFTLPSWAEQLDFKVEPPDISIAAYKRGYAWLSTSQQIVRMGALADGTAAQLAEMKKRMPFCSYGGRSESNLSQLYRALYADASALPPSELQQQWLKVMESAARVWIDVELKK